MSKITQRLLADIKDVTSMKLEHWDKSTMTYYLPNEDNMSSGTLLVLGTSFIDTPYFGGFYFFKTNFPHDYPFNPPKLEFLSTYNFRYNPNLYTNGKVCLSIIGTWGQSTWIPTQRFSSVIEAVRSYLFNDNPLSNEPSYYESTKSNSENQIYSDMVQYNVLFKNIYNNIMSPPPYALPFLQIMKDNFKENSGIHQKYIDGMKDKHNTEVKSRYTCSSIKYNIVQLQKKFEELIKECQ